MIRQPPRSTLFPTRRSSDLVFVVKAGPQYELIAKNPIGEAILATPALAGDLLIVRSEEHTSELQSLTNLVCRLLLEKKNALIMARIISEAEASPFSLSQL